jgi:DNA modification methylase
MILYAVKGKRPVNVIAPDVLSYSSDANLGHAAQKPLLLLTDLLKRSAKPGDTVLDPFMGTGSLIEAADAMQVSATGIEIDPAAFGIAVKRLERLTAQLDLLAGI